MVILDLKISDFRLLFSAIVIKFDGRLAAFPLTEDMNLKSSILNLKSDAPTDVAERSNCLHMICDSIWFLGMTPIIRTTRKAKSLVLALNSASFMTIL